MNSGIFKGSTTTSAHYILADGTQQVFGTAVQAIERFDASKHQPLTMEIEAFLLHMRACGRAESSIRCYHGYLARLAALLPDRALIDLDRSALNRVLAIMKQQAVLAETTLNKIRSVYRSFFQWAVNSGRCCCNPTDLLTFARAESFPTIPITSDETELLLTTISQSGNVNSQRDELLFATYAFAGIRRAEALRLKIGDFDASVKTLHLRKTKGGVSRIQPIPERLADLLSRYGSGKDIGRFFFVGDGGGRHLSLRQAQNRFDYWRESAGLRHQLTIHSFRAGYAGILYRTSGDIWLVARSIGHKNVASTKRYIESDAADIRTAIEMAFPWNPTSTEQTR